MQRKTIGLLINEIDGNYQTVLWLKIKKAVEKFDCNLIVFEGRALMCDSEVDRQHHIIYEFADKGRLDGLIVTSGTLTNYISRSVFLDFIKKYDSIPVISIGKIIPGATSLVFENKEGMKSLVRHLINEHGYRKIIFVTGPDSNRDSRERYQAYLEVLEESNIQFDENLVFHGDFLSQTGYIIMNEIHAGKIEYDAIVYANDDMALGAMQYLKNCSDANNLDIYDSVKICGFDDSMNSAFIKPALTTVRQPICELCSSAVELLVQKLNGQVVDEVVRLPATFVKRESCGCEYEGSIEEIYNNYLRFLPCYRVNENVQTYSLDELFVRITNLMQRCFIRSCFISTYTDGAFKYEGSSVLDNSFALPEKSNLIYAYYNHHRVDLSGDISFNTKDIVPDKFLQADRRVNYLVNPLFFINEQFGFVVFEVENDDVTNFEPLRGEISNTLKNALMLIEREKMEESLLAIERLESLMQLIGGISHNLLTPIMSVCGGCDAIEELITEIRNSVGDESVVLEDYLEIIDEMESRFNCIRGYMSYMSNVISTVRSQAIQLNYNSTSEFKLNELAEQIELIGKNNEHLKGIDLKIKVDDVMMLISGDVENLIVIIKNLLINAVQSYDKVEEVKRVEAYITESNDKLLIKIKDYGKGIPSVMKDRIFKSMFTTKGKNGMGLSLMLSYSTIKGKFSGEMWFESELGNGSTFYISIPGCMARSETQCSDQ